MTSNSRDFMNETQAAQGKQPEKSGNPPIRVDIWSNDMRGLHAELCQLCGNYIGEPGVYYAKPKYGYCTDCCRA